MSDDFKVCVKCDFQMNVLDDHDECFRHRVCNAEFPCKICSKWSKDKHAIMQKMIDKSRDKIIKNRESSATVTSQSSTYTHTAIPVSSASMSSAFSVTVTDSQSSCGGTVESCVASPFMGNTTTSSMQVTSPFVGNIVNPNNVCGVSSPLTGNNISNAANTSGSNFPFGSVMPQPGNNNMNMWPFMFNPFMNSESLVQSFIDKRVNELLHSSHSSQNTVTVSDTQVVNKDTNAMTTTQNDANNNSTCTSNNQSTSRDKRFNRLAPSSQYEDISDEDEDNVTDVSNPKTELSVNTQSEFDSVSQVNNDNDLDTRDNHTHKCDSAWPAFLGKVATTLNIEVQDIETTESSFKSFVPDSISNKKTKSGTDVQLPLEGMVLNKLKNVDKERCSKGSIRTYRSSDDMNYRVSNEHFQSYCMTPVLDDNALEGLTSSNSSFNTKSSKGKSQFRFKNKDLLTLNQQMKKVDAQSRLLLRQVSYATLFASYLDNVDNTDDKREALRALMEVFESMADVICRLLVNSVASRRAAHVSEMLFKNKNTEDKLLALSTLGPKLFGGEFFNILHESAENIRDAKETQFLRKSTYVNNKLESRKRKDPPESNRNLDLDQSDSNKKSRYSGDYYKNRNKKHSKINSSRDKPHNKDSFPKKGQSQLGFRPQK